MPSRAVLVALLSSPIVASTALGGGSPGPVAHWTFDEGKGAIAHDTSGYANDGAVFGAPLWTVGVSGGALALDGINDYVNCGNAAILNPPSEITISAWYRPTVSFSGSGNDPIVDKAYVFHAPPYYQYHLGVTGDLYGASPASFGFSVSAGAGAGTAQGAWATNNWYHLVGTYDGLNATFYVNGQQISTFAGPGGTMSDFGRPLLIGKFANLDFYLPGTVDDIQIYDRAVTCGEVQYLFEHPGEVSFGPGTVVADLSGDNAVSGADLAILLGAWGACSACEADLDCSGAVDAGDLAVLLGAWTG